jgi:rod shape-determining protein MreC
MRHFFSSRVRTVLIISLLVAAFLAITSSLTGKDMPTSLVQSALTPLRTGANVVAEQAQQLYDYVFRYESLEAQNESLRQQLSELQEDARQADALIRENERLRALLELKQTHEDYELVDGYIISRSSLDWVNTLTINRGADSGIEVGMCAITENGAVVGLVSEVGANFAVIKTVLDSSVQISATLTTTGDSGVVTGGYASGLPDMLRLKFLLSTAQIRNGTEVVTSGSTVYPRNLVLGYVVDAGLEDNSVAKYAILEPAADIGTLEQVFILTAYEMD